MNDLFQSNKPNKAPLAHKLRPKSIDEVVGQEHLLGFGRPFHKIIQNKTFHSMILWGPPGVGKTTIANILVEETLGADKYDLLKLNAVLDGVKEIKSLTNRLHINDKTLVVFIDEIHRFNKAQQDALLPFIEKGDFIFIGATTENPSFAINNALLSRLKIYILNSLTLLNLEEILSKSLISLNLNLTPKQKETLIQSSNGDARILLNLVERLDELTDDKNNLKEQEFKDVLTGVVNRFDNKGEYCYDQISALHKSIRGSDPDASLYWLVRMLDGGADPKYILRRLIVIASEDIGNADIAALNLATNAAVAFEKVGMPEAELILAQTVIYLAVAPKSNASYKALKSAKILIKNSSAIEVPIHLRNAPTKLMKDLGYGEEYDYSHDNDEAFSKSQEYFPKELLGTKFYHPNKRGLEIKISEKLAHLEKLKIKQD